MPVAAEPTTRLVQFVGLPNPFFEPSVIAMQARGELTEKRRVALRKMESRRQMQGFARVPGHTVRWVGPEHGFTRRYEWNTANDFTCEMAVEDIERLLDTMHTDPQMRLAHRQAFRVLGDIIRV